MSYQIEPMNECYAKEIMHWKYEDILSIYNFEDNAETLNELLTKNYYTVIDDNNDILGFFCSEDAAIVPYGNEYQVYDDKNYLDIGLGMNPVFINRGRGYPFLKMILNYFRKENHIHQFRLTVFDFNKRAIYIYHQAGFKIEDFFHAPNGHYFLVMTLDE